MDCQTYIIPHKILHDGENVLGAKLGEGWFAGRVGGEHSRNHWGTIIALRAQLHFAIGRKVQTATDGWQWAYGPLQTSELYNGEVFDTSLDSKEWSMVVPEGRLDWQNVEVCHPRVGQLVASEVPPNRPIKILTPTEIMTTPSGKLVVDFGQNMSGRVRIKHIASLDEGSRDALELRFAEVMYRGEIDTRSNRGGKAMDTISLSNNPVKDWETSLTMHGSRYVQISGAESRTNFFDPDNIRAVVIHSDMERLGHFERSHSSLNELYHCVEWGMRSNFVSVPTDCPQRDER